MANKTADNWYLCFSKDTPAELAQQKFIKRFNCIPEENFIFKNLRWVGPIVNIQQNSAIPTREE